MDALENDDDSLVLWAESPEEARYFLARAERQGFPRPARIFVAKRSGRVRANAYIGGDYYPTTDDDAVDVYNAVVTAPKAISELVQWCTCDVMLSRGETPLVVMEDTTHLVRMNLYQRFPRMARGALLGVPGIMLQGTRGLDFRLRGDKWALYRYLQAYEAAARVHPDCPPLPYWYVPSADAELDAERDSFAQAASLVFGDDDTAKAQRDAQLEQVRRVLQEGVDGEVPPDIPSIDYRGEKVILRVGARPDVKSWREKGSGQMDPYLGMILAVKYIYCYDEQGQKVKDLVLSFTHLPEGFWFFANPDTNALYKKLPLEFADEVEWLG